MRRVVAALMAVAVLALVGCGSQAGDTGSAADQPPSRGERAAQRLLERAFNKPAICELKGPRTNDLRSEREFDCKIIGGSREGEMYIEQPGKRFEFEYCGFSIVKGQVEGGCVTPSYSE
jgi:hypothetical protein